MTVVIARITVAEAATVINAITTFIQYTLSITLTAIFVYAIPKINTAIAWSAISRMIHASLWPTLLQTDSAASSSSFRVSLFSNFFLVSGILIAVTGIVTPLGLHEGELTQFGRKFPMNALYIADTSPIGLATSPRDGYEYSRICGAFLPIPCPGNGDNGNTSVIAPSTVEIFSSTHHGPFNMQFRRYYKGLGGYNYSMLNAKLSTSQSLILRDDIFAIDGLIVDLNTKSPGIGLWNHTMPTLPHGGTWSQDILWLEPVSSCVDTNLTFDYVLSGTPYEGTTKFNLTDRGGFTNLTRDYPGLNRDGQHIDIHQHAYKGAALSNAFAMKQLNTTRNESYIGRAFPLGYGNSSIYSVGKLGHFDLGYLDVNYSLNADSDSSTARTLCRGFGGQDTANITNVSVTCSTFLGPPERTDGGDTRVPGVNSTWSQKFYACASATRASIQRLEFSSNGTWDLRALRITRQPNNISVLWAVEKTTLPIGELDIFWGRVAESYENDPSLSTIRSPSFYVPAGSSDIWTVVGAGQPSTVPASAWSLVHSYSGSDVGSTAKYTGEENYALLRKFQLIIKNDPVHGPAQISNLVWTDLVANNLVGTDTNSTLLVMRHEPSVLYDLKYGIPAALLLAFWLPCFLGGAFMFIIGTLKLSHIRHVLNNTSTGRLLLGHSALVIKHGPPATDSPPQSESGCTPSAPDHEQPVSPDDLKDMEKGSSEVKCHDMNDWAKTAGQTLVEYVREKK